MGALVWQAKQAAFVAVTSWNLARSEAPRATLTSVRKAFPRRETLASRFHVGALSLSFECHRARKVAKNPIRVTCKERRL